MTIAEIKDTWEAYRASLVRADELRDELRARMAAATEGEITQSDIARALGLPRQAVSRYLAGGRSR